MQEEIQLCTKILAPELRFASWGLSQAPLGHLNMPCTPDTSNESSFGATVRCEGRSEEVADPLSPRTLGHRANSWERAAQHLPLEMDAA